MSVKRRGKSKIYSYEFEIDGARFRKSTETDNKAEAEAIEAEAKKAARLAIKFPQARQMSLNEAMVKYWNEHAKHLPSADTIRGFMENLAPLGERPISKLTNSEISEYVANRRGHQVRGKNPNRPLVSNATVNHDIKFLRAVIGRAKAWDVAPPTVDWKLHYLKEAGEHAVYLSAEQEAALFENLRPDFHALAKFCIITGARVGSARRLTWSDVDYGAGRVTFRSMKANARKAAKAHTVPITSELRALIANQKGNHPVFVFTYEAAEDRPQGTKGARRQKGERYPFSRDGWRRGWYRATAAAGIPDFRFHDTRHTAGSRITAASGIVIAQELLGHANITTTRRYSHVQMEDVAAAMEKVSARHDTGAPAKAARS